MKFTNFTKRAAHFLRGPSHAYSPLNDAIINALLELEYEVDLYIPGGSLGFNVAARYGAKVAAYQVSYGKRWLLANALSRHWRRYGVFSGTCEDPMAAVGILSWIHRRPAFTLADEIFSGSYRGDASEYWKNICRWGMRRSRLNIVNDVSRIALQREYAGLSDDDPVIVYPGCFRQLPPPGDRKVVRQRWGMPEDALVLLSSGFFAEHTGAKWLIHALQEKRDLHVALQPVGVDPLARFLLQHCRGSERMYVKDDHWESWEDIFASVAGADIGMSVYLHSGPQFQNMGTSSTRLCMFLSLGVPVIASRQPSFEFLERYDCGVLVENEQQFIEAIPIIQQRLPEMKANAIRCAKEYIDTASKYENLVLALKTVAKGPT